MATLKAMFKLFDGYSSTIDKINRKTNEAINKILRASGVTDEFNDKLKNMGASANVANSGLGKLVKTFISLAAAKKGIDITDEYTYTAARLDLINDSLQTTAELQDKIFAAADRSRGAYSDMAEAVSKMGLLAGEAFTTNDELIAFTELVQKAFKVSGATISEQQGAMRQLTQAMASGRLQGDELVSIMENAPMIFDAIAKYMGKTKGELREIARTGAITSDIIKNAMFMAADDINEKFEKMPMTFGDIWNKIKNGATRAFRPVIEKVSEIINSEEINGVINNIVGGATIAAKVIGDIINAAIQLSEFISDNWSMIGPIIFGIAAALMVYRGAALLSAAATAVLTATKMIAVPIYAALTGATMAQTAAQWGLNAAMYSCPITWVIISIIALIAIIYAVIGAINKFAGTSISATGVIAGAFMYLLAFVGNLFIGLWNLIVEVCASIWNAIATVAEFIANVFIDPVGSVIRLFVGMADVIYGILAGIASALDAIFGWNLTGAINSLRSKLQKGLEELVGEPAIKIPRANLEALKLKPIDYGKAWNLGYSTGEKIEEKLSLTNLLGNLPNVDLGNLKGFDFSKFGTASDPITVKGTGKNGRVEVEMSDEDLQYLRDIAQREYINKFTTATLAPNITVKFGDVHKEADADKLYGRIRKILQEEIAMAAEGVYS